MPRYDDDDEDDDEYDVPVRKRAGRRRSGGGKSEEDSQANTGMILGGICLIAWCLPIVGLPLSIWGIVASSKGLQSNNSGQAIAGLVMSSIGLIASIANALLGVFLAVQNE